jgi:hypothetical protein
LAGITITSKHKTPEKYAPKQLHNVYMLVPKPDQDNLQKEEEGMMGQQNVSAKRYISDK